MKTEFEKIADSGRRGQTVLRRRKKSAHGDQIGLRLRKPALEVSVKLRADDHIVRAGHVVDAEGRAAAIFCREIREGVFRAFGFRRGPHAAGGELFRVRHEHAEVMAVVDGDVVKLSNAS